MKKIFVVILSVAVIAGVGIIVKKTMEPRSGIENILPQNVSFYVQLHDVEKNLKELTSLPIWQGFSNLDYDLLMKKNAIDGQQVMLINLFRTQLSEVINNPMSKRLFGRDVAIAIYPLDKEIGLLAQNLKVLNPKFIEEVLSGVFFVTRVEPDVQFAEFVTRTFTQFGSNISQSQVEYKGEIIRTVNITNVGIKFGIVRLNDLLVIGVGDKAARISVDVYKRDAPSLAADPRFAKAQGRFLKPSSMEGYINFTKLVKELKAQADKFMSSEGSAGSAKFQEQWDKTLAKLAGLKAFAFSSQLTPLLRVDSSLLFDPDELNAEYASIYTCPPSENKTIHFTPQEVLGYYWSNCLNLDYYWKQIVKEMQRSDVPTSRIDEFEANLGLSVVGDILPAFGDEVGGYVQDIQVGGSKILLFVEVGNQAKAVNLLKKLEEQPFVMFQEEQYGGSMIKYIALPMGEDIQPAYVFLGDHLLISTSRKLVKESIDVSTNGSIH